MGGIYKSNAVCAKHPIANGVVQRIEIPVSAAPYLSIHQSWDASAAYTVALETSNKPRNQVAGDSTTAGDWIPETAVTLTGAAGGSAGGSMKHLSQLGSLRARLVITPTANGLIEIWVHEKE